MEAVVLLAIVFLGLPIVLSIVALSKANAQGREIATLRRYIEFLEKRLDKPVAKSEPKKAAEKEVEETKPLPSTAPTSITPPNPAVSAPVSLLAATQSKTQFKTSAKTDWTQSKPIPKPTPKPAKPQKSFEELIGAQWSVWVGGLTLLIGAVFLLRYSIEAGVFTPAMRVCMAALLGLVLLGAGEWLHRSDLKLFKSGRSAAIAKDISQKAYIPTLLTAVGIFTLFGVAYVAYILYGFIGALPAFALLGIISILALALSYRHGAVLAAIGLVGSMATPLLVQTDTPSVYMLYGYLAVIAAASLWTARSRGWGWLNVATIFGLLGWSMMSFEASTSPSTLPIWFVFLGLTYLANVWIAQTPTKAPEDKEKTPLQSIIHSPEIATFWSMIAALLIFAANEEAQSSILHYTFGFSAVALMMVTPWILKRQHWQVIVGAILGFVLILMVGSGFRPIWECLALGGVISAGLLAYAIPHKFKNENFSVDSPTLYWASFATGFPIVLGLFLFESVSPSNSLFAWSFAGLSVVFAGLAILLHQRDKSPIGAGVLAIGSAASYVFAVLIGLSGHAETIGLIAGLALSIAAVWQFKGLVLRLIIPAMALISIGHSLFIRIANGDVEATLIFNSLCLYFVLPAIFCALAAWVLSRRKVDMASEGMKALGLTFAVLFVIFQIRHIMNGGDVLAARLSFDELALQVLTGLSFSIGATRLAPHVWNAAGDLHTRLLPSLAMGVSSISLVLFTFGVCLFKSPLFNLGEIVNGNILLNSLMLGYLLPALALAFLARELKARRPETYIQILGGLSFVATILFVTGMIRFGFSSEPMSIFDNPPEGFELYAISAAWLVLGIALLVAGIKFERKDIRLASALLITLTVLKAFLVDMAELEGVLRALSFVVLGLILIVIGRSYQKILFTKTEIHMRDSDQEP